MPNQSLIYLHYLRILPLRIVGITNPAAVLRVQEETESRHKQTVTVKASSCYVLCLCELCNDFRAYQFLTPSQYRGTTRIFEKIPRFQTFILKLFLLE